MNSLGQDDGLGLGVQPFYGDSVNEWQDLSDNLGVFARFPSATMTPEKWSMTETPQTNAEVYPKAGARVNKDGLVVMRGLLLKNGGVAIATGDVVMTVPKKFLPLHPHQYRFFGGTCVLVLNPQTRQLTVDIIFNATTWVMLSNVIYYKD